MKRSGFTLLELIFVITIIAVLAAAAMFYFRSGDNELIQATNQLARHIRYAQHLALMDDRFDPSDDVNSSKWYGERWRIRFYDAGSRDYYVIFSDRDNKGGDPDGTKEIAIDPFSKDRLGRRNNESNEERAGSITHLRANYNTAIQSVSCDIGNGGQRTMPLSVVFDNKGRVYATPPRYDEDVLGAYEGLVRQNGCIITLRHLGSGETSTVTIHSETGFVEIAY